MNLLRYMYEQLKAPVVVFLLALIPFGFLFYYTDINVETALLKRRLARLKHQKELLEKKNRTLREEIIHQTRQQAGLSDEESRFIQNKIVIIKLPEKNKK